MHAPEPASPRQRPDIDGLRAVAILPVVLYHVGLGCSGGFVGVDIFFVISGFLIGGIILRELDTGEFSLAKFWERRLRRIVPVLLVFLGATLLAGWFILVPSDFASLQAQTTAALTGWANFKMLVLTGGYWENRSDPIPLLHTWSLAVEEQFYLFMPLLLMLAHRWFRRRIGFIVALLLLASLFLSVLWGRHHHAGNFYLLPTRAWELALGCLGVCASRGGLKFPAWFLQFASAAALVMILFSALVLDEDPTWPNSWTLLPTVATLVLLLSGGPDGRNTVTARILALPWLRFIGLISYSLYLWHWPIMVYLKRFQPEDVSTPLRWLVVAGSIVLAALSWRFVEQPFRRTIRGTRVPIRPLLAGLATLWIGLMTVSLVALQSRGYESAFLTDPTQEAGRQALMQLLRRGNSPDDHVSTQKAVRQALLRMVFQGPGRETIIGYDATGHLQGGGIQFNATNRRPCCVVLGSSHGMVLGPVIESLSHAYDIPCVFFTQGGTSPLFAGANTYIRAYDSDNAEKQRQDEIVKRFISQWEPETVIVGAKWSGELSMWGKTSAASESAFQEAFTNTVAWLGHHAGKVIIVGQVPQLPLPSDARNSIYLWRRAQTNEDVLPELQEDPGITTLRQAALMIFRSDKTTNLSMIDPDPIFHQANGFLRYYNSDGLLYFDDHHLNSLGSMELKPLLEPIFQEMARSRQKTQRKAF